MSALTAWNTDADLLAAGYVIAPGSRYIDRAHGIDWAVILWRCATCSAERCAPGPGEPPYCIREHGPMAPVVIA